MKLRTKLTLTVLSMALLPLIVAMGVSLWHSSQQVKVLTIDLAQSYLRLEAERLSDFFGERIMEMTDYANTPTIKTMDWQKIGLYLRSEVKRHNGIFEKFLLGTPSSHGYTTAGGNLFKGGLASYDDSDPNARLKSMAKRKYWQHTVENNTNKESRTYISAPLISYTTGVRQVVTAVTVLSEDGNRVVGMVGGSIPWIEIKSRINAARDNIHSNLGLQTKLCLVTKDGFYIYHWDPSKVIHPKLDAKGKPVLDEMGEKVAIRTKITDEKAPSLAQAGREMINGQRGFAFYQDPATGEDMTVIYSPVKSPNYAMALMISKDRIMVPVTQLRWSLITITLFAMILVTTISLFLSRMVSRPIVALNLAAKALAKGNRHIEIATTGKDEVGELTLSFNKMAYSLEMREQALKESEKNLRDLMESVPTGVTVSSPNGRLFEANLTALKIFGYDSKENFLKIPASAHYYDKKERERFIKLHKGGLAKDFEVQFIRKDGTVFWGTVTSLSRTTATGSTQYLNVFQDITEPKQMQDELAKHRDHLEEMVKERTDELTKANQQLNQQIEERKKAGDELKKRTDELQTMVNAMAGREVRMGELKKVIEKLRAQLEEAGLTPVADDPLKEVGKDYT